MIKFIIRVYRLHLNNEGEWRGMLGEVRIPSELGH